jgi:hypothetical protein
MKEKRGHDPAKRVAKRNKHHHILVIFIFKL